MEKIMSKTDDTKLGPASQVRELRDDELQKVSGSVELENVQITSIIAAGGGRTGKNYYEDTSCCGA
jgi:hypothetical protein